MDLGKTYVEDIDTEIAELEEIETDDPEIRELLEKARYLQEEAENYFDENQVEEAGNMYREIGRTLRRIHSVEEMDTETPSKTGLPAKRYGLSDLPVSD